MRAKALQYFAQCATSEDRSLVLKVKEMLHEALESPADGTPTVNRQTRGGSDKFCLPHCGIFVEHFCSSKLKSKFQNKYVQLLYKPNHSMWFRSNSRNNIYVKSVGSGNQLTI